jgi:hypothetical protein
MNLRRTKMNGNGYSRLKDGTFLSSKFLFSSNMHRLLPGPFSDVDMVFWHLGIIFYVDSRSITGPHDWTSMTLFPAPLWNATGSNLGFSLGFKPRVQPRVQPRHEVIEAIEPFVN